MNTIIISLVCLLISCDLVWGEVRTDSVCRSEDLSIMVGADKNIYEIGETILFRITFSNPGKDPFYVEFSGSDFGPESLNFIITNEACKYSVEPVHVDRSINDLRFDFVPLSPGNSYSTTIPINDPEGTLPKIKVTRDGRYKLKARFTSHGETIEGLIWPIWRDCVESKEIDLEFVQPSQSKVMEMVEILRDCLNKTDCNQFSAISFFEQVRITENAEVSKLLIQLLEKDPSGPMSSSIAEALFNQGRKEDASIFRKLSDKANLSQSLKDYYNGLAEKLENFGPCD